MSNITLVANPDSYSDIKGLNIVDGGTFSKTLLSDNDTVDGKKITPENKVDVVLIGQEVLNDQREKIGTITEEGDQFKFTVNQNQTDQSSSPKVGNFTYRLRSAGSYSETVTTVTLNIVSPQEAKTIEVEKKEKLKQDIAEVTGDNIVVINTSEDARKLVGDANSRIFNQSDSNSYIAKVKIAADAVRKASNDNFESRKEELKKVKDTIPLEWTTFTSSLGRISSASDPKEADTKKALKQYELLFKQIATIGDKKAQACMLRASLASSQSLSEEAKFVIHVQILAFCEQNGIRPEGINKYELDVFARNLPIFSYNNVASKASFVADFLSLISPVSKSEKVVEGGTKVAKGISRFVKWLTGSSDDVAKALQEAKEATKAAGKTTLKSKKDKYNKVKELTDKFKASQDDTEKAQIKKDLEKAARSLWLSNSVDKFGHPITNAPKALDSGYDAYNEMSDLKDGLWSIAMDEDSLGSLYDKVKDNSFFSWSTGMDALGAFGAGMGTSAALAPILGPLAFIPGIAVGIGKFTVDSWQKGRSIGGVGGDHITRFDGQTNRTMEKLAEFAGDDYSALLEYSGSSSSSPVSSNPNTTPGEETTVAKGEEPALPCA